MPATAQLLSLLSGQQAEMDLQTYFGLGGDPRYTGSRFESLGGGGDAEAVMNRITAEDLIAVQTLSVQVPIAVALDLLERDLGRDLSTNLAKIKTDLPIGNNEAGTALADNGPASETWTMLKSADKVGWVTAGKLLARKRPALIPVYDNVVRCAYGSPDDVWRGLNDRLRDDEAALPGALTEVGQAAGIPGNINPLRILDIVVWMRHRRGHRASRCAGLPELRI